MITKIVGRILRLPRNKLSSSFSTGGNGGKYGKPPSRPFFARRQEKEPQVQTIIPKPQEPTKVANKPSFLRSIKKTEASQPAKPQLRFRKKQTFDVGATEPTVTPPPVVKVKADPNQIQDSQLSIEQQINLTQSISLQTESGSDFFYSGEESGDLINSSNQVLVGESTDSVSTIQERYNLLLSTEETQLSISDDSTEQANTRRRDRTINLLIAQQLNQILTDRDPLRDTFTRKFAYDAYQATNHFKEKNWAALNQLAEGYYSSASALEIENEFHSYLIQLDGVRYVQWFNTAKQEHKDLSQLTLKKLYHKLLSQQAFKELKQVLAIFKHKSFKLTYSSIQDLYLDIQTDSKSPNLEQKIKDKIDITRHILDVQFKNFKLNSNIDEVSIVSIDTWFEKLASLALNRNIAVAKFVSLFQELFSNHYDHVNLGHFYKNNLFFDVFTKFYFGSHVSTQRVQNMFKDLFITNDFEFYLKEFRELLVKYRSLTGKFAFPNAKGLKSQLQKSFQQQKLQLTLLNYVLLIHSDQPYELAQLMQKRHILLKYCEFSYHIRDILDDALFNLPSHVLSRRQIEPRPLERTVRRIHPLDDAFLTKQQEEKLKVRSQMSAENNRKLEKMLMDLIQREKATGVAVDIEKQYSKEKLVQLLGLEVAEELILKQQIQKMKEEARLLMRGNLDTQQVKEYYLNSEIPLTPQGLKGEKKWKDYQFQQEYRFKDPKKLGWDYNKYFISYYGTLIQQAQSQGNPYRKQLIRNILRADLRTSQQDIRRVSFSKYDNDEQTVDVTQEKDMKNQYEQEQFEEYVQIRANEHGLINNTEEVESQGYMYQPRQFGKKYEFEDLSLSVDNPLASAFEAKVLFDDLLKTAHLNDLFLRNGKKQNIQQEFSSQSTYEKNKKINPIPNQSLISHFVPDMISKNELNKIFGLKEQPSQFDSQEYKKMKKVDKLVSGLDQLVTRQNMAFSTVQDPFTDVIYDTDNSESIEMFYKYSKLMPKDAEFMWKNDYMSEESKAKLKQEAVFQHTILEEITVGYLSTEQPQQSWQDIDRYSSEVLQEQGVIDGQNHEVVEGEQIAAEGEAEGVEVAAEGQQVAAEGQQVAVEGEQVAVEGEEAAAAQGEQGVEGEEAVEGEQEVEGGSSQRQIFDQNVNLDPRAPNFNMYTEYSAKQIRNKQNSSETQTQQSCLQTPAQKRQRKYKNKVLRVNLQQKQLQYRKKLKQQQIQYKQKIQQRVRQQIPIERPVKLFILTKMQKKIIDDPYQIKNAAMSPNFNEEVDEAIAKMYKEGAFNKYRQSALRIDEEERNSEDVRNIFNLSSILYDTIDDAIVIPSKEKANQQKKQQQQQKIEENEEKDDKIYLKYHKTKVQQFLQKQKGFQYESDMIKDSQWSTTFNTSDFVSIDLESELIEGQRQSEKSQVHEFVDLMKEFNPVLVEKILAASGRKVENVGALIKKKLQQRVNDKEKNQESTQKVQYYEQMVDLKDNIVRQDYIDKLVDLYLQRITKSPQQYKDFKQALKSPQKIDKFIKKYKLDKNQYPPSWNRKIAEIINIKDFPEVYDPNRTIPQLQKLLLNQSYSESIDEIKQQLKLDNEWEVYKQQNLPQKEQNSSDMSQQNYNTEDNQKDQQQARMKAQWLQWRKQQPPKAQQSSSDYFSTSEFDKESDSSFSERAIKANQRILKTNICTESTLITDQEHLLKSQLQQQKLLRNEKHIQYQQNIPTTDSSDLLASQNFSELEGQVDMREVNKERDYYINKLAIKSAIKLKKYELALALCKKVVMEPLIVDRTTKNITFAVQKFLIDEHQRERIPNFEDIIEHVPVSAENLEPEFLMSVHERCDSFDELIWNYVPPKKHKFQYWQATLMFNRGQEIVKMDIANKLKDLKYQREYQAVPERQKDDFISFAGPEWRQILLEQLGLMAPKKQEKNKTVVNIAQDTEDFKEKFFTKSNHAEEHEQHEEQLQEVEAEGEEAVQEEGHEQAVQEGEQAQEAQEGAEVQAEVEAAAGEVQASHQAPVEHEEKIDQSKYLDLSNFAFPDFKAEKINTDLDKQYPFNTNFNITNDLRIRGYDFESFLKYSKENVKPILEEKYEMEKEYIKHVINLQALAEEARSEDSIYLQKRIFQDQKYVKNPQNIAIFASYGLWSYNFVKDIRDPIETRKNCAKFRRIFYQFKRYDGKKGALEQAIFNNEHFINFEEKANLVSELKFSGSLVDDLLVRRMKYFKEAEAVVRIQPSPIVEELMAWGVKADEPMAIYLAEKIAMITNQIIPHPIAQRVSRYLSHRHYIPAERIERCKQALKVVGRINREHIYDFNREYDHITVRKHFTDHLEKRQKELDSSAVQFLMRVDPTHTFQSDTKNLENNIKRSAFVV